jgi:hypothetical protein
MASTIKLKNGSGAPTTGDLVQGEPALDLTNKRLYTENASGVVIEVGTNPSTIDINAGTIDGTVIGGSTAAAITGTTITGTSFVSSGDMTFGDSDKAIFGAGGDLEIYHDGSASYIKDLGTGPLAINTNGSEIMLTGQSGSEYMVRAIQDGAVQLFHNNALKLATTATGIDVTGTVTADGLTVDGNSVFTTADNSAQVTLISTDTDALVGPQLNLWRNSGAGTNGDLIGQITFTGEDTVGSTNTFASIYSVADQTNNGSEDGSIHFQTLINGVLADRFEINSAGNSVFTGTVTADGLTVDGSIATIQNTSDGTALRLSSTQNSAHSLTTPFGEVQFYSGDTSSPGAGVRASIGGYPFDTAASGGGVIKFQTSDSASLKTRLDISNNGDISFYEDTGTTAKFFWDASAERLGIGTSSPISPLQVLGTGTLGYATSNAISSGMSAISNAAAFNNIGSAKLTANFGGAVNFTGRASELVFAADNGNFGGGGGFAQGLLGAITASSVNGNASTLASNLIFYNTDGNSLTERARIDSSGRLLVNTTSQLGRVTVDNGGNTTGVYVLQSNSGINHVGINVKSSYVTGGQTGTMIKFIQASDATVGTISSTITATAYNTSSDQRLKENITDASSASDDIDAIQVRSFDWKADRSHQKYGMVAQELQSVAPIAVTGDADSDEMMGVDYSKLVPMMLKEIQSLRARVAQLEGAN